MSDSDLRGVVEKTEWCINKVSNMYGMPTWGHTVKHYCRIRVRFFQKPPGFVDIPQHLNDHHLYNEEVSGRLDVAKDDWDGHEVTAATISKMLDARSSKMKSALITRGSTRTGGTHAAWLNAVKASEKGEEFPGWHLPFSMAIEPTARSFPLKGDSGVMRDWINAISAAMRL